MSALSTPRGEPDTCPITIETGWRMTGGLILPLGDDRSESVWHPRPGWVSSDSREMAFLPGVAKTPNRRKADDAYGSRWMGAVGMATLVLQRT